MAVPRRPTYALVDEAKLADSRCETWMAPAELARVRWLCEQPNSPSVHDELDAFDEDGTRMPSLFHRLASQDEPEFVERAFSYVCASVTNDRRRAAIRAWANAHDVSRLAAADRFNIGFC